MAVAQHQLEVVTSYRFEDIKEHSQLDPIIVQAIVGCVRSAFEGGVTDEDALHHIQGDLVTVDIDEATGRALAFSSTDFGTPNEILNRNDVSDDRGCYLAGATVAKEAQGAGLYKRMNENRIQAALDRNVKLVFTRTQNPRVQAGIEATLKAFRNEGLILGYSMKKILVPGCYGGQLTKTRPVDDQISFDDLDYDKGDAYIILFEIQYPHEMTKTKVR